MEEQDKKESKKLFWTIGEVAAMFDVNASKIRYWADEFKELNPERNNKGNRMFKQKDIDTFHMIFHLVEEKGMTLEGAKKKLKNQLPEVEKEFEVVKTLKNLKGMILELRQILDEKEKQA